MLMLEHPLSHYWTSPLRGGALPNNFQQKSRIWEKLTLGVFAASVNAPNVEQNTHEATTQLNHGWHSTTMEPNAQIDLQFETFFFFTFQYRKRADHANFSKIYTLW